VFDGSGSRYVDRAGVSMLSLEYRLDAAMEASEELAGAVLGFDGIDATCRVEVPGSGRPPPGYWPATAAKDNGADFGTLMQRSLADLRTAVTARGADDDRAP